MFRLVRGTGRTFTVLDVLQCDQVALRIHELLSTVQFMLQTLAAVGELQGDRQRELSYDGLRAAEARGSKGGRRPAVAADETDTVRTTYLEGRSIAALARDHGVSRGAIRTAVTSLLPDRTANEADAPARRCRSPSTCRARPPNFSAPLTWSVSRSPKGRSPAADSRPERRPLTVAAGSLRVGLRCVLWSVYG
ncbi:hypothetical protein SGRIM119S_01786 [Streptomyces griseorubiginosus]